jgi:PKD repeat protein
MDVHTRTIVPGSDKWAHSMLGLSNSTAVVRSSSPVTLPALHSRFTFYPTIPEQLTWLGANSNWNDPLNWGGKPAPSRCNDVVIPTGKSYYPELSGSTAAECKNLKLEPNAGLTLKSNFTSFLTVYGNLINDGVLTNNTSSYVTLAGGEQARLGGEGHFIGTDLFITANSSYYLQKDLVIRNLSINSGSALFLEDKILDVFAIQQNGTLNQGTGVLVIEGDPASVLLNDSTFEEASGTTFFGNGEVWASYSNQTVPSLSYHNLWVRTNKDFSVQLGTDQDFSCNNLMFYNPGEPGGRAETARQLTVRGDLKLGIDSLPGTELTVNHPINRINGAGQFGMGVKDNLNITHASPINQPALSGFGSPSFAGSVSYSSNTQQTVVRGTYSNLSINGAGQRFIHGKVNLRGILELNEGTLVTNDSLSLKSDSIATALISGNGTGQLSGTVESERFIYGSATQEALISSAFQNLSWNQYADDFPIIGPDGIQLSSDFNASVYEFRESGIEQGFGKGWFSQTTVQDPISSGTGYLARIAGGSTLRVRGIINTGNQKVAVSSSVSSGSNKGWNLVGNPYPSPIDWNKLAGTNPATISKAMSKAGSGNRYTGNFATWLPLGAEEGLGINGATRYVGIQEGFFVRAFSSDTLRFSNACRAHVLNTKSVTVPDIIPYVRLSLLNESSADELLVYFSQQCSNQEALDGKDAAKLPGIGNKTFWYSIKDSVQLGIQGRRKLEQPDSVALGISVSQAGYHEMRLSEAIHLPSTAMIFLEDRLNNTYQNLRQTPSYSVYLNAGTTIGRFFLHIRPGVNVASYNEGCSGGEGRIVLTNQTATLWDVRVQNSADSLIGERNSFSGIYELDGLNADEYTIHFRLSGQNLTVDEWTTVEAGNRVVASFTASETEIKEENKEVVFTNNSQNAEQLFWNFGDGMIAAGESEITHTFDQPGTYTVVLTANRGECSDTASAQIYVLNVMGTGEISKADKTTFTIYPNPATTIANLSLNNDEILADASLFIVDMSGKLISEKLIGNIQPKEIIELPVANLSKGNYEVVIHGKGFKSVSRLIVSPH